MNDYQLIHLAADRQHDFQREAAAHRLARHGTQSDTARPGQPRDGGQRRTLRLTLGAILGRSV